MSEKQKVKLFMVDEAPYVVTLEQPQIGDTAIVTVGGQYPSIVECENETVLNLLTDSKLTLTQSFRVILKPNQLNIGPDQLQQIMENGGIMEVEEVNGELKFSL
jgi:hypothetical protein